MTYNRSPEIRCSWPGFHVVYDRPYDPAAVRAETARLLAEVRAEHRRLVSNADAARIGALVRVRIGEARSECTHWRVGDRVFLRSRRRGRVRADRVHARVVAVDPVCVEVALLRGRNVRHFRMFVEKRMLRWMERR